MRSFLPLILFILFFNNVNAKDISDKIYTTVDTFSYPQSFKELLLLVQVTQKKNGLVTYNLKQDLFYIERCYNLAGDKIVMDIIESQIFKVILRPTKKSINIDLFTNELPGQIDKKIIKGNTSLSLFSRWIVLSANQDLKNIFKSISYDTLKKSLTTNKSKHKPLINKLMLIYPILNNFMNLTPEFFNSLIYNSSLEILKNITLTIENYLLAQNMQSRVGPFYDNIILKTFKEIDYIALVPKKNSSETDIIEETIKQFKNLTLEDEKSKWFPRPDSQYIAPEKLPIPTNEWKIKNKKKHNNKTSSIDPLDPLDPDYIPPMSFPFNFDADSNSEEFKYQEDEWFLN